MLQLLVGTHDFKIFACTGSSYNSSVKTIYNASIYKTKYKLLTNQELCINIYNVKIKGNAFLYKMVRNIIGSILLIQNPSNIYKIKSFEDMFFKNIKIFNFKPAEPNGLYLTNVQYKGD